MSPSTALPSKKPRFKLFPELPFLQIATVWLAVIWLIRLFELGLLHWKNTAVNQFTPLFFNSLLNDWCFVSLTLLGLYPVYRGLGQLSTKLARRTMLALLSLLTIIQIGLTYYYSRTFVLLGADLFGYSLSDIRQTVGAAGGFSLPVFMGLMGLFVGLFFGIQWLHPLVRLRRRWLVLLLLPGPVSLLLDSDSFVTPSTEQERNLAVNKTGHFVSAAYTYLTTDETDYEFDIYAMDDEPAADSDAQLATITYTAEEQFPFLHPESTPDVLGPFFRPAPLKPNVVLIIVEGLSQAFSGDDAPLGSFTPFLDSLAEKSLYWNHFLSQGGRTFAVLPSLLGSLPFARNGFSELGTAMPPHLSLVNILKKNGYRTAFYYGGSGRFDNMDGLLRRQGIDRFYDEASFGKPYRKMPGSDQFTWGYGDKELFRNFFDLNATAQPGPSLQVLLTLSTHDPFLNYETDAYLRRFEKRLNELSLSEPEKQTHRASRLPFASVLYLDDALKNFFAAYRKRPDFQNTIFVVTGDHRLPEIPMLSKIDRYHVPLLIYSPLLRQPARFRSVSTHFDVAPSLLAYLRENYRLHTPSQVAWMGTGLDTARAFRNTHAYPIMMTKAELADYVMGTYFLNNDDLYRIGEGMKLTPLSDPAQATRLREAFGAFRRRNQRLINGAPLLPDSVIPLNPQKETTLR